MYEISPEIHRRLLYEKQKLSEAHQSDYTKSRIAAVLNNFIIHPVLPKDLQPLSALISVRYALNK